MDREETTIVLFPPGVTNTGDAVIASCDSGPGDAPNVTLPPVTTTTGPKPVELSAELNVATPAVLTKTLPGLHDCGPPKLAVPVLANTPVTESDPDVSLNAP